MLNVLIFVVNNKIRRGLQKAVPLAGLREKQKAERERRILAAAVAQFRRVGYHAARIEDLAGAAEVSVGTVYNYHRTKGDILIAVVAMEVEEVLAAGEAIIADPPPGVARALLALTYQYYEHSLHYLSKEMWRAAMALSIDAPDTPNGRRYSELDGRLAAQVTRLVRALAARGEVRPRHDPVALGELLFNNLNMLFIEFVKDEAMTIAMLKDRVTRQTALVAELIAKGKG